MPPFTSPSKLNKEKTTKAAQLLAENVSKLMNSDTYKAALEFRTKFYRYSFNNSFLIYVQCPDATYVAGYRRWQELGRQVRKGEKAISILAPILKKVEEDGKEEKRLVGFRSASIFDVSQTDGDELPELPRPERLTEDSETIQSTLRTLETYATEQGFPVQHRAIEGNALGKFSVTSKTITLRDDLAPLQETKTLIHELAHALMHQDISPQSDKRHLCELEAESCAFLVCHSLGLDTSRYSFPYLAGWADDPAELLPAAEKASQTANRILETLRGPFFCRPTRSFFSFPHKVADATRTYRLQTVKPDPPEVAEPRPLRKACAFVAVPRPPADEPLQAIEVTSALTRFSSGVGETGCARASPGPEAAQLHYSMPEVPYYISEIRYSAFMAIYHLNLRPFSRGKNQRAASKRDYVTREGRYKKDREELLYKEAGNLPSWAESDEDYWKATDRYERANGRLGLEVEIALPRELNDEAKLILAKRIRTEIVGKTQPYTMAIHLGAKTAGGNPHVHLIFSERKLDGIERSRETFFKRANSKRPERGGVKKDRSIKEKRWLEDLRSRWAEMANEQLEREAQKPRIDHRSLLDQGVDRTPGRHLGPRTAAMNRKGVSSERGERLAVFAKDVSHLEKLQKELEAVTRSVRKLERGRFGERTR